ncbi:MAG: DUF2851 family protein [Chitinophagaceae bacterium]|nr:MAG: DUF2851 family protein [Chitinophagaceae bacterium]
MKEDFLHFVWKYKKFNPVNLQTDDGQKLLITKSGFHNYDGGPDFLDARIMLDETSWAGNVEIHIKASDWYAHGHHLDKKYNNVILHVVAKNDKVIFREDGTKVPALNISPLLDLGILRQYKLLQQAKAKIPCHSFLPDIDRFIIDQCLDRMIVERLEDKTKEIQDVLQKEKNDWEYVFLIFLSKYLGGPVNSLPMELLIKSISYNTFQKKQNSIHHLESLLFGQSGMLNTIESDDDYIKALKAEYFHYKKTEDLKPIENKIWQFLRLRPGNFPTIRIAQLCSLYHHSPRLFHTLLMASSPKVARQILNVSASEYWNTHYVFNKTSRKKEKKLGKHTANSILINVVIPFMFLYGSFRGKESLKDKALSWLENIPAENNSITKTWLENGIKAKNALESQALIELKKYYCTPKQCLKCNIGIKILESQS